jgi:hypothetical protein
MRVACLIAVALAASLAHAASFDKPGPPGLDEVYVRIAIGTSAHAESVQGLEPAASAAFKRCVDQAVRGVELPRDSLRGWLRRALT